MSDDRLASIKTALLREIGPPTDRDNNWQPMVSAGEVRALLDALDAAEAEAMNTGHDYDRRGERLWRLAALAGHVPGESDNDATAELAVTQALATAARDALLDAARYFEYEMANAWGRDTRWLSTGSHVADLVAGILRERAADATTGGEDRG